jgi:hypothetical protein
MASPSKRRCINVVVLLSIRSEHDLLLCREFLLEMERYLAGSVGQINIEHPIFILFSGYVDENICSWMDWMQWIEKHAAYLSQRTALLVAFKEEVSKVDKVMALFSNPICGTACSKLRAPALQKMHRNAKDIGYYLVTDGKPIDVDTALSLCDALDRPIKKGQMAGAHISVVIPNSDRFEDDLFSCISKVGGSKNTFVCYSTPPYDGESDVWLCTTQAMEKIIDSTDGEKFTFEHVFAVVGPKWTIRSQ